MPRAEKTSENRGKWKCRTFQGNYGDVFLNDLEMARLASCYDVEIIVECYVLCVPRPMLQFWGDAGPGR